jgi:hypothetical protein
MVRIVIGQFNNPDPFSPGVEIAPLPGRSRGLDWTGELIIFAEDR